MALLDGVSYKESILETIGNTPLVKLNKVTRGLKATLLAKVESFNPGGSVKDRIGIKILEQAEAQGLIKPGGTIVESTSGNTGMGLAIAAAVKGYRAVFVMPDKMSLEKINLLKAMGAEVVVTPTAVPPESPDSYYSVARRLAREIPNAFLANQYFNDDNPLAHYESTGPEIWKQTAGKITHYIVSMGTGGTISGAGRYLKEQNPNVKVIGVDPEGSILRDYFYTKQMTVARPYKVEGIGEDIIPGTTHFQYIDEIVKVNDRECLNMARRISRTEGILVGGSCGAAVAGAIKYLRDKDENTLAVVILPDTGERYLSKVYNDAWMRDNGLLELEDVTVADVLKSKRGRLPELVTVDAADTVRRALDLIREYDITSIPVFLDGKMAGSINENTVMRSVLEAPGVLDERVGRLMEAPLPIVQAEDPVREIISILARKSASSVLVMENNQAAGIITRTDVIGFVSL
ncbi:MAG: cystathionine beta-synthase [Candidatus Eisenbacteria bacterium]|nr:cystathionine beta-synthase [Candidatus Eisenbacteria bacterium]